VQLRSEANLEGVLAAASTKMGVRPTHVYHKVLPGFAARLSGRQRSTLLADSRVLAIHPDQPVQLAADPQPVPPGIRRVGAKASAIRRVDGSDPRLDVDIAILDTGIQAGHPDLRVVGGKNCTPSGDGWDRDRHGHGTHVAGIAAARDNGFGVVGVAAGARLWSVKVLDHHGNGFNSWLVCGLDWVATRADPNNAAVPRIEVANMSLRTAGADDGNCGLTNGDLLHQAICRLNRAGVTAVVAAGNDSKDAADWVPAAYDEVITVSALADYDGRPGGLAARPAGCSVPDDAFAGFSNYGRDVDLIAPGVCVRSTFKGSSYTRMSGTSMATPHVAGGAALYHLHEARAGRKRPTPPQTLAALRSTASGKWRVTTDADARHEPLLNVASFDIAPGFRIGATPLTQVRRAGQKAAFDVWLARLGGFSGKVAFDVSGQPAGSSWSFVTPPFGGGKSWRRLSIALPSSAPPGTHKIEVTARSAGQEARRLTVTLHIEGGVLGAAGAPRVNLRSGVVTGRVALPLRVTWAAVSGAQRYELQVRRDGGAWTQVKLGSATATRVDRTAWPTSIYRYRLRVKKGGTWGKWLLSPASFATPRYAGEEVRLRGSWTSYANSRTYSERPAYSKQSGARARLDFVGRSVSWIATKGPTRGKARVYIDGVLVARVDLYASTRRHRRVVFSRSWASQRSHRIVVEVVGTKGRPRVDVDAIVVVSSS
jgi:subtilisin